MINNSQATYRQSINRKRDKVFTTIRVILKIFLGIVFIFSGFVKSIDPLGYTYKLEEYFSLLGTFSEILKSIAFPLAIAVSTFELALGLCFIFNIKPKLTVKASFFFMLLMLPLTLFLAVTNKISDCGCFGDALVLSNWETFYKNVIIVTVIILLWVIGKKQKSFFYQHIEWTFIALFIAIGISLSVYSYRHLPMIDFRPYKIGVNIPESMEIPEGKSTDKYETTLIYSKNGEEKEFTIENYPKSDDWTFVDQKTVLVEKGYTPPIHDFSITTENQEDYTDQILTYQGTVNLIIMYDLNKTSKKGIEKANQLYELWKDKNTPFIGLTGSTTEDIDKFKLKHNTQFPIFNTDPITLKTIVRANPGLVTLNNGTITGKWHWRDF